MKKYIGFILILLLAFFLCGCSKKEKKLTDLEVIKKRGYLIAGVKEDSPPFGYYKDGKLQGIDIEIAKSIANSIFKNNYPDNIKYIKVTAQDKISKLNSKEVDILVAIISVNDKRKLVIDFSEPYFVANQKIMVRKDSKITNILHFNKQGRVGVILGTTGEKMLHLIVPNASVIGVKTYPEAVKLLKEYDIDAIFGDDCILECYKGKDFKIINRAYSRENYAVALRKSPDSKELLNEVNSAISTLLDKKQINAYKKQFIND